MYRRWRCWRPSHDADLAKGDKRSPFRCGQGDSSPRKRRPYWVRPRLSRGHSRWRAPFWCTAFAGVTISASLAANTSADSRATPISGSGVPAFDTDDLGSAFRSPYFGARPEYRSVLLTMRPRFCLAKLSKSPNVAADHVTLCRFHYSSTRRRVLRLRGPSCAVDFGAGARARHAPTIALDSRLNSVLGCWRLSGYPVSILQDGQMSFTSPWQWNPPCPIVAHRRPPICTHPIRRAALRLRSYT